MSLSRAAEGDVLKMTVEIHVPRTLRVRKAIKLSSALVSSSSGSSFDRSALDTLLKKLSETSFVEHFLFILNPIVELIGAPYRFEMAVISQQSRIHRKPAAKRYPISIRSRTADPFKNAPDGILAEIVTTPLEIFYEVRSILVNIV